MEPIDLFKRNLEELSKRRGELESRISRLPEGSIKAMVVKGRDYYRATFDDKREYLSVTKDLPLINELLQRKYFSMELNDIDVNMQMLQTAIASFDSSRLMLDDFIKNNPYEIARLEKCLQLPRSDFDAWAAEPFETTAKYQEQRSRRLKNGVLVRSKGEEVVGNGLVDNEIAFRYEWAQEFAGSIINPDFTILLRRFSANRLFYWEHLGLTGDPTYDSNTKWKLDKFLRAGLMPCFDFIFTFDDSAHPTDSVMVQNLIDAYLK